MLTPNKSRPIIDLEKELEQGGISQIHFDTRYQVLKEKQKFFGFSSPRRFWYAIGMPIMVLFFSLLFLNVSSLLPDRSIRKATRFASTIALFIALYFIIYVLWPGQDLPENIYYVSLVSVSVCATALGYFIVNNRFNLTLKIQKLIRFISVDTFVKYVKEEDKDDYLDDSFSVYDDITK